MEIQEGREGTRRLCADFVAEVGCRWRSGPGTAVTIPLIAARAGGLDACTDARDACTSTQRSAKRRITQRTTIAGLFPSSCRLSSLGLVAVATTGVVIEASASATRCSSLERPACVCRSLGRRGRRLQMKLFARPARLAAFQEAPEEHRLPHQDARVHAQLPSQVSAARLIAHQVPTS
jgi:hypothetical protein